MAPSLAAQRMAAITGLDVNALDDPAGCDMCGRHRRLHPQTIRTGDWQVTLDVCSQCMCSQCNDERKL
jgi:hypothetical protein